MYELNNHLELHKVDARQRQEEVRRQHLVKQTQAQKRKSRQG